MRTAVIGIGSNSVRMLVADIENGQGRKVRRERAGTRLFAGLDGEGRLSPEAMAKTVAAVSSMAAAARQDGAAEVRLFATSATRDAANSDVFAAMLKECANVELEICTGEEEAALSFLGATRGGSCGVIDIGGGSTEIVVGDGLQIDAAFSCQMGAVRLFRLQPITSAADLPVVEAMAADILEQQLARFPGLPIPSQWVGTGGTFTALAALVKDISWTDRTYMHGTRMTRLQIEEKARMLADLPLEKRLELISLQPNRADIVVHGICILTACMERLGIDAVTVSEYGNLDGYTKRRYGLTGEIN